LIFASGGESQDTDLLHHLVSFYLVFLTQKPTNTTRWALRGDNLCRLLQGVILLETKQNYETPLVVSCLSADPFRDNGFIAILSTLPDYTAVHFRRPDMP
jgi:hypothetical protein